MTRESLLFLFIALICELPYIICTNSSATAIPTDDVAPSDDTPTNSNPMGTLFIAIACCAFFYFLWAMWLVYSSSKRAYERVNEEEEK